jgi:hypothetical protein
VAKTTVWVVLENTDEGTHTLSAHRRKETALKEARERAQEVANDVPEAVVEEDSAHGAAWGSTFVVALPDGRTATDTEWRVEETPLA